MRKIGLLLVTFFILMYTNGFSQLAKNGWEFGGGLSYPRLVGSDLAGAEGNFGAYVSLQRDISEHVSLRAKPYFSSFSVVKYDVKSNMVGVGLDVLYTFLPCDDITPYIGFGLNSYYLSVKNAVNTKDENIIDYSTNFIFGVKNRFKDSNLGMKFELGYFTAANDKLDGFTGDVGGVLGGTKDSWMTADLGVLYYFNQGPLSHLCDLYGGYATAPKVAPVGDKVTVKEKQFEGFTYPVVYQNAWRLNLGFNYPRMAGTEAPGIEGNYGLFAGVSRDLSEHFTARVNAFYDHLSTSGVSTNADVYGADFDFIYKLVPFEPVVPYFGVGFGLFNEDVHNPIDFKALSLLDYRVNMLIGAEWKILGDKWTLSTELAYYSLANDKLDGRYGNVGGLLGGTTDAYMAFKIGAHYLLSNGEKSSQSDIYDGVRAIAAKVDDKFKEKAPEPTTVDYAKIEDIVKKYAKVSDPVDYAKIEKIVKDNVAKPTSWVLVGVNFDFNEATLRPESYPILANAAEVLLANADIKVEIQGHTDNIGSAASNLKLSERRAETVKGFLLSKGVAANRLTTKGFGDTKPISDNSDAEGRALNRRVEFKVVK